MTSKAPDPDLVSTIIVMEHILATSRKSQKKTEKKLEELALKHGILRQAGESPEDLIARMRDISRNGFPDEEIPTKKEKRPL